MIVALIALVGALGGTASALPGKSKVKSNDLAKGAVTKRAIDSRAVTAAKIADAKPPTGVTAFGNGGQNDCIWQNTATLPGSSPVSYYKDQLGFVHLEGIAVAGPGDGGDADCDDVPAANFASLDQVVFTLPPGFQPDRTQVQGPGDFYALIAPDEGIEAGEVDLAPGTVIAFGEDTTSAVLDGITFRTPASPAKSTGKREQLQAMEPSVNLLR